MQPGKTAVITVHGVGNPVVGAMPVRVVEQLQQTCPGDYRCVDTVQIALQVTAAALHIDPATPGAETTAEGMLPAGAGSRLTTAEAPAQVPLDVTFTRTLLEGGDALPATYHTARLRSTRGREEDAGTVDFYEMYWADLSHGAMSGGIAIFSQLVQVFLHIASLGRSTLASMQAQSPQARHIAAVYRSSAQGYWLLAVPIVLGNLLFVILGALLPTLLLAGHRTLQQLGAAALWGLLASAAGALLVRRLLRAPTPRPLVARLGVAAVLVIGVLAAIGMWHCTASPKLMLFGAVACLLAAGATAVVRTYDASRPGARAFWIGILCAVVTWGAACALCMRLFTFLPVPAGSDPVLQWFAYWVEGCFSVLALAWVVLYGVNFVLLGRSLRAVLATPAGSPARKAIMTALVAAALPVPICLSVVLFLWVAYAKLLEVLPLDLCQKVVNIVAPAGPALTVRDTVQDLVVHSFGAGFLPYLLSLGIFLLAAVWGLLPSVLAEWRPRKKKDAPASEVMGNWLDSGFTAAGYGAVVAMAGYFVLVPLGIVASWWQWVPATLPAAVASTIPGTAAVGSLIGFLLATKLLGGISLGGLSRFFERLRIVVDIGMDVDNWLRERPIGETPRLRIMARYTSLLAHIAGQGYERVVIVAHSQGSVVTVDLFRYLQQYNAELVAGLSDVHLLTLGCPLRQLYAQRFPGLYGWANNASPDACGFKVWKNAYGSGDYVGRYLWRAANDVERWSITPGATNDICIGALAHTRYFDKTAPEVGHLLHGLIS